MVNEYNVKSSASVLLEVFIPYEVVIFNYIICTIFRNNKPRILGALHITAVGCKDKGFQQFDWWKPKFVRWTFTLEVNGL
jgi:hypothetical protein